MDSILNQSRPERLKESLAAHLRDGSHSPGDTLILCAPSDHGVQRNGGRSGARWAPQAILNVFSKLTPRRGTPQFMRVIEVSHQNEESISYEAAFSEQAKRIRPLTHHPIVHLGGGHDHVLALLSALDDRPLCVINIDAHLDTRVDPEPHSGNPFRQFSQTARHVFSLHQIGIHPFANSASTQSPLPNGKMYTLLKADCQDAAHLRAFLARLESELTQDTRVVFSLDCDALKASDVEAVSAPNHDGLSLDLVLQLVKFYRDLCRTRGQNPIWGVYEFNPVYDTVSSRSARAIAGLVYEMIC